MYPLGQRKCSHCKQFFVPDPRQRKRQRYCVTVACRLASKAASQRRWLARPENHDHFCGPENVQRVQAWRAANPGYAKRARRRPAALQEMMKSQPAPAQEAATQDDVVALQDMWRKQPPVLLGLIAHLTGTALQEDMAVMTRKLFTRGASLLGPNLKKYHDRKTSPLSGTRAASPAAF